MFLQDQFGYSESYYRLIKAIGESTGKDEQRSVLINERDRLKDSLSNSNSSSLTLSNQENRKENVLRAFYCELLGYDASFAYVNAINLAQHGTNVIEKKVGYLFCGTTINKDSSLNLLLVNSLLKDLDPLNNEPTAICAALTLISQLKNAELLQNTIEAVLKSMRHEDDRVRRKAIIAYQRAVMVIPESISLSVMDVVTLGLSDSKPIVMSAVLPLVESVIEIESPGFEKLYDVLANILDQIAICHNLERSYDYHKIQAPWSVSRLLNLIMLYPTKKWPGQDRPFSDNLSLSCPATNTKELLLCILGQYNYRSQESVSSSLVYEICRCLCQLEATESFYKVHEVINYFMDSSSNLLKYGALRLLNDLVQIDPQAAKTQGTNVIDCLESTDENLRRAALRLITKVTNSKNYDQIIQRVLGALQYSNDNQFRHEVLNHINDLNIRYTKDVYSYLKTSLEVLLIAYDIVGHKFYGSVALQINNTPKTELQQALERAINDIEIQYDMTLEDYLLQSVSNSTDEQQLQWMLFIEFLRWVKTSFLSDCENSLPWLNDKSRQTPNTPPYSLITSPLLRNSVRQMLQSMELSINNNEDSMIPYDDSIPNKNIPKDYSGSAIKSSIPPSHRPNPSDRLIKLYLEEKEKVEIKLNSDIKANIKHQNSLQYQRATTQKSSGHTGMNNSNFQWQNDHNIDKNNDFVESRNIVNFSKVNTESIEGRTDLRQPPRWKQPVAPPKRLDSEQREDTARMAEKSEVAKNIFGD